MSAIEATCPPMRLSAISAGPGSMLRYVMPLIAGRLNCWAERAYSTPSLPRSFRADGRGARPLLQTLWEGLVAGVLYALIALGFVLIFKASGVSISPRASWPCSRR